jgi:AcrR family transcriptional regulator
VKSQRPLSQPPTRRTEGVRVQGRSARVVDAVLLATAEQLGEVGFAALRIEDVAARSGVNKTTIYRRWPRKEELVASVLETLRLVPGTPDTGTLRGDLLELLDAIAKGAATPAGRGLMRLVQTERGHPEFAAILRRRRSEQLASRRAIFERAIARGELPVGSDSGILAELVLAPLIARLFYVSSDVNERFIHILVDTVVAGARSGAAVAAP